MQTNQMINDNPYCSPVGKLSDGKYDHTLFWRIVKVMYGLALGFLVIDAILILTAPRSVIKFQWLYEFYRIREMLEGLL